MHDYDRRAASPSVFWAKVFAGSVRRDPASFEKAKEDVSSWSDPSEKDWASSVLGSFLEFSRTAARDVAAALSEAARRALIQADFFEGGWATYDNGRFKAKLTGPFDENVTELDLRKIMKSLGLEVIQVRSNEKRDEVVYHVEFDFPPQLLGAVARQVISAV